MATTPDDVAGGPAVVRPMRREDLPLAERLTARAYAGVHAAATPRMLAVPAIRPPERAAGWIARAEHLLGTDPGGCWVAEANDEMVGLALSFTRELTWFLASYAVAPTRQGQGIGAQLLDAALAHGRGCLRGMLNSSSDPVAARRYRLAGFELHPTMSLTGTVDHTVIPDLGRVRAGTSGDRDQLDSVDRRVRGSAHGPDHEILARQLHLLVIDDTRGSGSGYAYVDASGSPAVVAATDRRTASLMLWAALASAPPGGEVAVPHVSAANQWALDVGLAAGLVVHPAGYQALRHLKPPAPYLPHGSLM